MATAALDTRNHPARPVSGASPILAVEGACRHLGGRSALDDVHVRLFGGETLVLLGPNGAGKTSLVRALTGTLRLEAGCVRVCGQDPHRDRTARRLLGLVPQEIALYPELTARENLEILGRLAGVSKRKLSPRVAEVLAATGLSDRAQEQVRSLSGGMKRRLNIGAALLHRPKVLLLDEPTVGVDPTAREAIHRLLGELRREGLGILLATHDLDQATELADRIAFLLDGRIRAEGELAELVERAFGDARELSVTLSREPGAAARTALRETGLFPVKGSRLWTGALDRDLEDVSELAKRLEGAGAVLEEVRIREPGLKSVFFKLTGEELSS